MAAAGWATVALGGTARANTPDTFTGLDTANPAALDDPNNYSLNTVPSTTNDAVIDTMASAPTSLLTFNSSTPTQAFGSLNVNTSSPVLIYNAVPNTSGGTTGNSVVTLTLGGGTNAYAPAAADLLYVGAAATLSVNNSSASTVYGNLNIALAQSGNFDVAGTAYVGSTISGAFALTKTGTGTLTLAGANTFTGGLTISQGTLAVASATYVGPATFSTTPVVTTTIAAGATLSFTNTSAITSTTSLRTYALSGGNDAINIANSTTVLLGGVISGTGALVKTGPGGLILGPTTYNTSTYTSNTYTGGTNIAAGSVRFATQNAIPAGTVTFADGTALVDINTSSSGAFAAGVGFLLNGSATFNESTAAKTFTLNGSITGTGALTKAGGGTVYLASVGNTYTGGTNLSAGTLRSNATLGTGTGTVTINAGLLGGNGSVGAVVVNAGGTVGAGSSGGSVGTLTTAGQTWNTGGALLSKVAAAGTTADAVVMSSLSDAASSFTVNISNASTAATVTSGTVLVLAVDTDPLAANPFNASGTAPIALSTLMLNTSSAGVTFSTTTFGLATQADTTGDGGYDLVLEDTAAAPEPTSLLLLSAAAAPLAVGRRRATRRAAGA